MKVGLLRPITLFPFPYQAFSQSAKRVKQILVVEMSLGQMIEDVKLAVCGTSQIHFYGRVGGMVPSYDEIVAEVEKIAKEAK